MINDSWISVVSYHNTLTILENVCLIQNMHVHISQIVCFVVFDSLLPSRFVHALQYFMKLADHLMHCTKQMESGLATHPLELTSFSPTNELECDDNDVLKCQR